LSANKYLDKFDSLKTYSLFPGTWKQLQFVATSLLSIVFLAEAHCPVREKL
jgi:hypothetical protein